MPLINSNTALFAAAGLAAVSGWLYGPILDSVRDAQTPAHEVHQVRGAGFLQSPLSKCLSPASASIDVETIPTAGNVAGRPVATTANPSTDLHCTPHRDARITRSYGQGHRFIVTGTYGDWVSVKALRDGNEGWVKADALVSVAQPKRNPQLYAMAQIPAAESGEPESTGPLADDVSRQRATANTDDCRWTKVGPGQWTCQR